MRWISIFLVNTLLAARTSVPREIQEFQNFCHSSPLLTALGPETNFFPNDRRQTLESLTSHIRNHSITSPVQLYRSFLSDAERRWPRNSFLLGRSQSAQRSRVDSEHPRAIVYGNDLILASTGHSNPQLSQGNHLVEVIQYDRSRNQYRFGLINFQNRPPTFSEPPNCRNCHGTPPRPIWQPMHFWDRLTRVPRGIPLKANEGTIYDALERNQPNLPVVDSWNDAAQFTAYLDSLNQHRVATLIQKSPGYTRYRYATLAAILGCPSIDQFVPESLRRRREQSSPGLTDLIERTGRAMRDGHRRNHEFAGTEETNERSGRYYSHFPHIPGGHLPEPFVPQDAASLGSLRYLFPSLTVPWEHLSSHISPNSQEGFGFAGSSDNRTTGTIELSCHFLPSLVEKEPELLPLLSRRVNQLVPATPEECTMLRVRSLRELQDEPNAPLRQSPHH